MSSFSAIDLSKLPAPDIVEPLDFETIFAAMLADLKARDSDFDALVESDPAYKILEVAAYREQLLRQRVNDAAKACMVATAVEADLDNLAAYFNVKRLVLDPGDPNAIPPVPPVKEKNDDLRRRIALSLEAQSVAGPEGAYLFHALSADGNVQDIDVSSPSAGNVVITVLSKVGNGTPDQTLLDAVEAVLTADDVRPLTDNVTVQGASIVNYSIDAEIVTLSGVSPSIVTQAANDALTAYLADRRGLGRDITRSGLISALMVPNVQNVTITSPATDVAVSNSQAAYATSITVNQTGIAE